MSNTPATLFPVLEEAVGIDPTPEPSPPQYYEEFEDLLMLLQHVLVIFSALGKIRHGCRSYRTRNRFCISFAKDPCLKTGHGRRHIPHRLDELHPKRFNYKDGTNLLKATVELCPPNPNELDRATFTVKSFAILGTMSMPRKSGSGSEILIVG